MPSIASVHMSLGLGLLLIARVVNGKCHNEQQLHVWSCNPEQESRSLPQDILICVLFAPVIFSTLFKSIKQAYVAVSWGIVVLSVIIAIGIGGCTNSIPILIIYVPISIIVCYENYRQSVILFLTSRSK